MKKYIVFIFAFLFTSHNCFGQSGWYWQNPVPSINSTEDIVNINGTVFLAKDNCQILKSMDLGLTWSQGNCQSYNHYNSIQFLNSLTGYACGNYTLVKTTDSGNNWSSISSVYEGFNKVHFFDESTGFILNYIGSLYRTSNGGISWDAINTGGYWINDFCFVDQNDFFCCGQNVICKTTNGGSNWIVHIEPSGVYFTSVRFLDVNTGLVGGSYNNNAYIINTSNSGLVWNSNTISPAARVMKIQFVNNLTAYGLSANGYFLKSTNAGNSWTVTQFDLPNFSNGCMNFVNSVTGFIDGFKGRLFKTTNSGVNWSFIVEGTTTTLYSVFFIDSALGFAAGDSTKLFKTTNGGSNWVEHVIGPSSRINSLCFLSALTGFVACDSGKVFKTTDSGNSWFQQNSNTNNNLKKVKFENDFTGFIGGGNGFFAKTSNGGINWLSLNYGSNSFFGGLAIVDTNLIYLTAGTKVYESNNNGLSWILNHSFDSVYLADIAATNKDTISVIGTKGYPNGSTRTFLYTTFNAGITWNNSNNFSGSASSIGYIDSRIGYILIYNSLILTTNAGLNWSNYKIFPTFYSINSIFFNNSNTAYAVGDYGTILKTTDGGGTMVVGVQISNSLTEKEFLLSQNYPNPFNPSTKIKFEIPPSKGVRGMTTVKLIIYDLLGREITTIVNEELKPGTYSADWDGTNFASGIYFYRLESGEYAETKKMVLMK